ncbi:MAG TPA: winged helix-turn-helix domain-containing protein [Dermatophilaceae bacterium]
MTYLEAALRVLRDEGRPLGTRELTDLAIARGLIVPVGKTPDASMATVLYAELQRGAMIRKLEMPGPTRAARGTVRWVLNPGGAAVPT